DYYPEFAHAMPVWWTIGKSLSHGDDVAWYPIIKNAAETTMPSTWEHWHKVAKASEYPITTSDFYNWFEGPNANYLNVGRTGFNLLTVKYPDDDLLTAYCYDKAHNLSHANGTVFGSLNGSL